VSKRKRRRPKKGVERRPSKRLTLPKARHVTGGEGPAVSMTRGRKFRSVPSFGQTRHPRPKWAREARKGGTR
jgi:hypothetical protein